MDLPPIQFDRLTRWHFVLATLLAAAGVVVTCEAWRDMYFIASSDDEYSHIFLVPFVFAWMVWVRRIRLRHCPVRLTMLGPVIVIAGWWLGHYGFNHGRQSFWHAGAIFVLLGCLVSVVGKATLLRFLPAAFVLLFLVPLPGYFRQMIALPLQAWTAQIAKTFLDLIKIDTEVSGNTLTVNGIPVTIAEACNGMKLVFPLLLLAYAFAFGLPLKTGVRVMILAVSPLVALACNVVRIVPTVWLYGRDRAELAGKFHDWSAWAMLPVAFLLLMSVIRLFKWLALPVQRYTLAAQT
jgi:exosortase